MVIAVSPAGTSGELKMSKEIELVRSAVLYADTIELVSPFGSILSSVAHYRSSDAESMNRSFADLSDAELDAVAGGLLSDENRDQFRHQIELASLDNQEIRRRYGLQAGPMIRQLAPTRAALDEAARQTREGFDEIVASSGSEELLPALESGVVTLSPLGEFSSSDPERMMHAFAARLTDALADPDARVLFDDSAAQLAQEMIEAEQARPSTLMEQHAKEARVGTGLIVRLPAFPDTPLDELLDLRGDLDKPLARYRREVNYLGRTLTRNPFGPAASAEVDDVWRFQVSPALDDLREELADHGLVKEIARSTSSDAKSIVYTAAGPSVYMGMQALTELNELALWTGAALTGSAAVHHSIKGLIQRNQVRRRIEKHDLFYLLELDRRL